MAVLPKLALPSFLPSYYITMYYLLNTYIILVKGSEAKDTYRRYLSKYLPQPGLRIEEKQLHLLCCRVGCCCCTHADVQLDENDADGVAAQHR